MKGIYHKLPYNCYYFTVNNGANLNSFEILKIDKVDNLNRIHYIIENGRFLGDSDIVPFVPEICNVNIIVIDYRNDKFITEYINNKSDCKYVVFDNSGNMHYSTIGVIDDSTDMLQTLFDADDPFIQKILNSKEHKGNIEWN